MEIKSTLIPTSERASLNALRHQSLFHQGHQPGQYIALLSSKLSSARFSQIPFQTPLSLIIVRPSGIFPPNYGTSHRLARLDLTAIAIINCSFKSDFHIKRS
ncbi:hypothetical protein PGTUg99_014964 [Puccinia graminis f. sp. tritici]|uniref:Uncharacterized protein n=1 Tax=Puccinia graminis f. sp. tritici TaxID=56615 RepID=A0A5B0RBE4_PUCGR|nr:hypothetical protein PGTUg99_014964 [Puccinia graminis f. sp. tritici]